MSPARFLVGGYSPDMAGAASGIGLAEQRSDGTLAFLGTVAETSSPSWLLVSDDRIYAAAEGEGAIRSFRFHEGALIATGSADAAGFPCHLELDGDVLLAANYGGGVLGALSVGAAGSVAEDAAVAFAGGGSGPHPAQDSPHVHASLLLDDGRILVADLGTDTVTALHRADRAADGYEQVGALRADAGTGPRDLVAAGGGRVLLLGELSDELLLLDVSGRDPVVIARQVLPGAEAGDHAAGIAVDTSTGRVYVGLRGSNLVSVVDLDGDTLSAVGSLDCGGDWPRHLVVRDGLLHVANQLSGTVASFLLHGADLPVAAGPATPVPSPTHLLPLPARGWERLQPLLG